MSTNITGAIQGGNVCLSFANMTDLAGAATTITTANAMSYAINGKLYTKAAIAGGATPTTDVNTGVAFTPITASKACAFVFGLDSAGNVKVAQGKVVSNEGSGTVCPFPLLPDSIAPFAYVVIKGGSTVSGNWVFGSSNWNATGITCDPVQEVMALPPSDPQTA